MTEGQDRLSLETRVALMEREQSGLAQDIGEIRDSFVAFRNQYADDRRRDETRYQADRKEDQAKQNRILLSVMGLLLTILGGIVTALIVAGASGAVGR